MSADPTPAAPSRASRPVLPPDQEEWVAAQVAAAPPLSPRQLDVVRRVLGRRPTAVTR